MPESKDSPSAQSIGKCSETVQDWVNRNENPSKEYVLQLYSDIFLELRETDECVSRQK